MKRERIDNAIKIINYAIDNNIALGESSIKHGFADNYVHNTKYYINVDFERGDINEEYFNEFHNVYDKYLNKKIVNVEFIKPHDLSKNKNNETITIIGNGDEKTIEWISGSNYPKNHIKTLDDLLLQTNVDIDVWNVKDYIVNKWDVTSWKNDIPQTIENFQVKARLEKNVSVNKTKSAVQIFKEMVSSYEPPIYSASEYIKNSLTKNSENNILEICIFDLHVGKLAWGGETGENYDTKIARKRFIDAILTLLKRAKGFEFSKILFPIGNDFFNSDTINNTTTHGTPQDEDLRWQKTFKVGVQLLVDGINILKSTGVPIDVMVIPGNHDFERSFYMGSFLEAWFNNDSMVKINNSASPRKYYKFGEVLLGFTHGSEEKENSLPLIMASDIESKPMWSETKYHEWHLGHQHRRKNIKFTVLDKGVYLAEDLGVTVRYMSSLTGTEEWHHKKGYIGQVKAADAFIWNDKAGLMAHLISNLGD